MKINDVVRVHDGSYCMSLTKGHLQHITGSDLKGRHFRVRAMSGIYPTQATMASGLNNILLVEDGNPNFVLFTQERFCDVVPTITRGLPPTEIEIIIPRRAKVVHLILPS